MTYLLGGSPSASGQTVNEATAFNVPVVMSCVAKISRTVMTLPIDVFERLPDGRKRPVPDHPLARLFDKPNTWQDWPMLVQMMQAHLLLRGNAYAWINWTTNTTNGSEQATELIPLHPDRVRVKQRADWTLEYTLLQSTGGQIAIPSEEMFHLRGLSTDGVLGRSLLQDAREAIGGALSTQEHANALWSRDATPSVVLQHPKTLSEKAQKGLEEKFEQTYGPGKNKRRVAVLEEGMTIERLSLTPNDGQFLDTRKFSRSEIADLFGVPPHMIGDTDKSTSWGTGIEQQKLGYLTFTIQPWLTIWEAGIKRCLIFNERRFYAKFKVEGLLRGDSAARADFYERMWRIGVYTINMILALEDLDPIDGGDVRFVPMNFTPLGTVATPQQQTQAQLSDILERLRGKAA